MMIISKEEASEMLRILTGETNPSIMDLSPEVYEFYKGWILPFLRFQHAPYIVGLMTVRKEVDFDDPEEISLYGASVDKWTVEDLLFHNEGVYPTHVWPGVPIRYNDGDKAFACGHCVKWRDPLVFTSFELIFDESLTCDYCESSFEYADSG